MMMTFTADEVVIDIEAGPVSNTTVPNASSSATNLSSPTLSAAESVHSANSNNNNSNNGSGDERE